MKALLALLALGLAGTPTAQARTLHVGPGQRYRKPCQAIAAARPGDVIEIDARGNPYRGDVCAWSTNHLTIVGVHGRAHLEAAGQSSEGKAIWVIAGDDTTIENVEFSGARVPDQNGAGIRQEGANLLLEHCYFHDNQEGILAADNPASSIAIDSSVFAGNGAGDGYSHNIYINHVRSFTLRYSYSTDARVGHLVKSRALRNYILYDRLTGEHGTDSYELDLPNGGLSYVIGTIIEQGSNTQNPNMLAYGEEGDLEPGLAPVRGQRHVRQRPAPGRLDLRRTASDRPSVRRERHQHRQHRVRLPARRAHAARLHHEPSGLPRRCRLRLPARANLKVSPRRRPPRIGERLFARPALPVRTNGNTHDAHRRRRNRRRVRQLAVSQ